MDKKPCPDLVKKAGAELLKLRRLAEQVRAQGYKAANAVEATKAVLMRYAMPGNIRRRSRGAQASSPRSARP